jgi:AraC-like DNA-binding protein
MDNICVWTELIAESLERISVPAIPFLGPSQGGFNNRPGPFIQYILTMEGFYTDVHIGDITVNIPPRSITMLNVHLGSYTDQIQYIKKGWGIFLGVEDIPACKELEQRPLYCTAQLGELETLAQRFEVLTNNCVMGQVFQGGYMGEERLVFDPADPGPLRKRLRVKASLLLLLARIIELTKQGIDKREFIPEGIQKARIFIMQSYRYPDITLDEIADEANLSIDHFGRQFKKYLGETPVAFLNRIRIERASLLPEQRDLRINEIARECGFDDPLYFSRVFKKVRGIPPTEFRDQKKS